MTISVVIPVYNGERFIARALNSVLGQTRPPEDIVVVNDGSTDETSNIVEAFKGRVRKVDIRHSGRSVARNHGMQVAVGEWVAFLDADDEFLPGHLAQLDDAALRTGAELVHDACWMPFLSDAENEAMFRRRARETDTELLSRFHFTTPNAMVNKAWVMDRKLSFDESLDIGEDALFFMSMLILGARRTFVPIAGVSIGIHKGNSTRDCSMAYRHGVVAYERLERFVVARGINLSSERRTAVRRGKHHGLVMHNLMSLYLGENRRTRRALLRLMFATDVLMRDRLRCLFGQFWPALPFARRAPVLRTLFGYGVMRMEQERKT